LMASGDGVPDRVVRALARLERGALVVTRRPENSQ